MDHIIRFNKDTASQYYYSDKENSGIEWAYNHDFISNMMKTAEMILRSKGYLYLRDLYEKLGINALAVSPILGWDEKQHPKFKYKIVECKDIYEIQIIVNPKELKNE